MTPIEERLAEALAVLRIHGTGAQAHIAERIGTLAVAGDAAGVEPWRQIAPAIDGCRGQLGVRDR